MRNQLFIAFCFIVLSINPAFSVNDITTNYSTNGTAIELNSFWTEYNNLSISTGTGQTFSILSVNVVTNYSIARAYARIKRDGVVIESFNLTQSTVPETVSFIAPTTETEGTHYYSFEAYSSAGRKVTLHNRTFSVQYLKTGDYTTLSEVNSSAQITRTQVTGQEGVDTAQNTSITNIQSINTEQNTSISNIQTVNVNQNNSITNIESVNINQNSSITNIEGVNIAQNISITNIQGVDTSQNTSITNIEAVNVNQNTSISTKTTLSEVNSSSQISRTQVIGQTGVDTGQNTSIDSKTTLAQVNSSAQIGESQVTNLVTDLGSKLNIATYTGDFPNATVAGNLANWNATNTTVVRETLSAGANLTYSSGTGIFNDIRNNYPNTSLPNYLLILTYGSNFPNSTVGSKETTWDTVTGKTTLVIVNSSAQITRFQVTGQEGVDTGQNTSIDAKTTLSIVNASAQLGSSVQITGLNTALSEKLAIATYGANFPNTTVGSKEATWDAKEPAISQGVSPQLWVYNKTWQNITTTWITEGVNLWFTTARTISAVQGYFNYFNTTDAALQANDTVINQSIVTIQSNETGYDKIDGSRSWTGNHNAGGKNLTNIFNILDPTGKYYLKNNSVFCGVNTTCTYNANGTVSIASTGAGGGLTEEVDPLWSANYSVFLTHVSNTSAQITISQVTNLQAQQDTQNQSIDSKTTLTTVNTSAQLGSSVQVTGLDTALSGKEPVISSSTASKFYGWDKTFKDILISYIPGLQEILNSMNSSSAANNTASQGRDDAINSTKLNKTDLNSTVNRSLALATDILPSERLSVNTNATTINFIWDGAGSVLTTSNHNISIDYSGTIINAALLGDTSGNATVNITRTSYTSFPNSFAPLGNISMVSSVKTKDTTLTGWNTSIYVDDVINFKLSGTPANLTKLTVKLYVQKN